MSGAHTSTATHAPVTFGVLILVANPADHGLSPQELIQLVDGVCSFSPFSIGISPRHSAPLARILTSPDLRRWQSGSDLQKLLNLWSSACPGHAANANGFADMKNGGFQASANLDDDAAAEEDEEDEGAGVVSSGIMRLPSFGGQAA